MTVRELVAVLQDLMPDMGEVDIALHIDMGHVYCTITDAYVVDGKDGQVVQIETDCLCGYTI